MSGASARAFDTFDLTCWYINIRRVTELVNSPELRLRTFTDRDQHRAVAKDDFLKWLRLARVDTLGKLLLTDPLPKPGTFFTHYSNFYGKGLGGVSVGTRPRKQPEVYSKLDDFRPLLRVRLPYDVEHLTSTSAWTWMMGQQRLFVFGSVVESSEKEIVALPYVVGRVLSNPFDSDQSSIFWAQHREVWAGQIDSFARIAEMPQPTPDELEVLRDIPEDSIKNWFAEILGERVVPKDWGGESSDLFTTELVLQSKKVSSAFVFKGKGHFREMKLGRTLGANGDQIVRLFDEPAELLVLQHVHQIHRSVRAMMRTFAAQQGNLRLFCIIDGFTTLNILRAYGKLSRNTGGLPSR